MAPILDASSRILICRTDNIGDLVQTLPLAGFLKTHIPGIRVDFLVRDYTLPVVELSRFVDQVFRVESIADPEQFFRAVNWTAVIFAWPQRLLSQAAKRAKIPHRVGHSKLIHHWISCNRLAHFSRSRPPRHEAQINFAYLRPLGVAVEPDLHSILPWYGLQAKANAAVDACARDGVFHLILHTQSGGNGREWPLNHYLELAQLLATRRDTVLWVTGSAREGDYLCQHMPALLEIPNVVNLCGRFDLGGLASLIARADGLIASGTGPLHLAAALGTRTLGLFPTARQVSAIRWGALGARAQNLVTDMPCKSCPGMNDCKCMRQITPQQVMRVVSEWQSAWRGEM